MKETINQNPEQIARDNIDKQLSACGWIIQSLKRVNRHAGIGVAVREYLTDIGPADYVLFVEGKPCAVIEAKREEEGYRMATHESQAECYATAPSESIYWQQGHSTERDFIYVTTQTLTHEQLQQLSDDVGTDRSLLVLCLVFRGAAGRFPNLTIKKIPKQVNSRCEWGHDDYSLKIENLPKAPKPEKEQTSLFDEGEE